jgi:galactose mutarotase-like enzyme
MPARTVTLTAPPLTSMWVPSVGMVGASLRHRDRELLGLRGGLESYRARGSTFGIPLLHPWANRLGGFAYRAGGVDVALDAGTPGLRTEEHGLPIHGLVAASPDWRVTDVGGDLLCAELRWEAPEQLEAFPFPHRLALEVTLAPEALTVATTLEPTGDRAVPVAFGFHPYFTVPGIDRDDVVLRHPAMTHLPGDERGLPTGERAPIPARDAPLRGEAFDDLYTGVGDGTGVTLAGGPRAITMRLVEGYTHLQLFAPPDSTAVAIEPMTAPTNALRTGDGLRVTGEPFRAVFAVEVGPE